jgi:hypothetical protein
MAVWKNKIYRLIETNILKYLAVPPGATVHSLGIAELTSSSTLGRSVYTRRENAKKKWQHSTTDGKVKVIGSCETVLFHFTSSVH